MSTKFTWSIPNGITPTCFTNIVHSIRNSSSTSAMESWSVEEVDVNNFVINFRSTSSEAGNLIYLYSDYYRIGTIELDSNIESGIFYTIKVEYPKVKVNNQFDKYIKLILKSQDTSPYPVFAFNSHTHVGLLNPINNRYIADVSESSIVNELGCIAVAPGDLVKMSMIIPGETPYKTPIINDIYDFR